MLTCDDCNIGASGMALVTAMRGDSPWKVCFRCLRERHRDQWRQLVDYVQEWTNYDITLTATTGGNG